MAIPKLEPSNSIKSNNNTIKFLCSYGGKIVPRYPDGKLRYHGGHTRVLSVHRSVSFSEVMLKMGELSGGTPSSITLRCQLPTEDLDALITIKSDEDLANLFEEYNHITTSSMKIRAFILQTHTSKTPSSTSPSSSPSPSPSSLSPSSSFSAVRSSSSPRQQPPVMAYPAAMCYEKNKSCQNCSSQFYLVHDGNYWQ